MGELKPSPAKDFSVEGACEQIVPFLKWAGGKRWLVTARPELFSFFEERYIEPFVGSGAVFFHLAPQRAILSDANAALIETYSCIAECAEDVRVELAKHAAKHSEDYYYKVRSNIPATAVRRAGRFIYLNRTCWNGLYRVNRNGEFNVPKGTKEAVVLKTDNFARTSQLLARAEIASQDFEKTIDAALADDFIFVDPPYTVKHNLNGFIKYNENLFSWDDQIRLRNSLIRADRRGARILVTNADHRSIRDLYKNEFRQESITRSSVLSGSSSFRGAVSELIIRNW